MRIKAYPVMYLFAAGVVFAAGEGLMPVENMIIVGAIVAVFVTFMALVAYGDLQTRRARNDK